MKMPLHLSSDDDEKYTLVIRKTNPQFLMPAVNVFPAPLTPTIQTYTPTHCTLPEAVQLQFKNRTRFGNFVKQGAEHYTTNEKNRA